MSGESDDPKKGFGISKADDKGDGETKYDKPATGGEDLAIDERRDKPILGSERADGDRDDGRDPTPPDASA